MRVNHNHEEDKNADTRFPLFAQPPCWVFGNDPLHVVWKRGCAMTDSIAQNLDLSSFADPNAEVIRLDAASGGDSVLLSAIKEEIRREEAKGWCHVIHMTDDVAVIRWLDQFVLTLGQHESLIPEGGADV